MTTQKTLKRRVRARAAKTGESYTAARAQVLRRTDPPSPAQSAMELAGMTDEAMLRGSGRHIAEWLELLDASNASAKKHADIARWLVAEHGIGGWWAQSVTVAYERARGMRAMRERPDGYAVSVSRTIAAAADRIADAMTDASLRARWFDDPALRPRTLRGRRSGTFDWDDPPSRVAYGLTSKGAAKTQIAVQHERLPDGPSAERMKVMWRERLGALKELLESE
jgi:hypothetical protein